MRQHDNKSKSWMVKKRKQLHEEKFRESLCPRKKKKEKKSSREVGFYRIPATKISFFAPVISRGPSVTEIGNSEP